MRRLALFDLDGTLLAGDSDYEWGRYLVEAGGLDRADHERRNRQFYEQYQAGVLDLAEFLDFQLAPLSRFPRARLDAWHAAYLADRILPIVRPGTISLLDRHRGDVRVIVSATNRFVVSPIARALSLADVIATDLEEAGGRFTGRPIGTPSFREGKVVRVHAWLAGRGERLADFDESWFYSDSINDLPLLSAVTHPVVVHPDEPLLAHANAAGWPVVSLESAVPEWSAPPPGVAQASRLRSAPVD